MNYLINTIIKSYKYSLIAVFILTSCTEIDQNKIETDFCSKIHRNNTTSLSKELSDIIGTGVPSRNPILKKKSIRRCFQAIRIHVNGELDQINEGVIKSINLLDAEGIVVTISYHSLEDKIVKKIFHEYSVDCICPKELPKCICKQIPLLRLGSPKKLKPKELEIKQNSKSKSAVLRFAVRL